MRLVVFLSLSKNLRRLGWHHPNKDYTRPSIHKNKLSPGAPLDHLLVPSNPHSLHLRGAETNSLLEKTRDEENVPWRFLLTRVGQSKLKEVRAWCWVSSPVVMMKPWLHGLLSSSHLLNKIPHGQISQHVTCQAPTAAGHLGLGEVFFFGGHVSSSTLLAPATSTDYKSRALHEIISSSRSLTTTR